MGRPKQIICAVDAKYRTVCHERFSKLLHDRVGRIQGVKKALGKYWPLFVRLAKAYGKPRYIRAFTTHNVYCRGPLDGNGVCTGPEVQSLGDIETDHRLLRAVVLVAIA